MRSCRILYVSFIHALYSICIYSVRFGQRKRQQNFQLIIQLNIPMFVLFCFGTSMYAEQKKTIPVNADAGKPQYNSLTHDPGLSHH